MKPRNLSRKISIAGSAFLFILLGLGAFWLWQRNPSRGLPYQANFNGSAAEQWTAYAGTWETTPDGSMRNDSNDRGAKLITGSPHWKNYAVEADIQLLGPGDAGLIVRVQDAEPGVDSYTGFYAGLRTMDRSLVLGRAQHGWSEFPPKQLADGVLPFHWYHLRLSVVGCTVATTVIPYDTGRATSIQRRFRQCSTEGSIGLRSYYSGGMWRNVRVHSITDVNENPPPLSTSVPTPESAVSRRGLMADYIAGTGPQSGVFAPRRAQSILSLRFESQTGSSVGTIRGLVVLTTPGVYVEDSTAGVAVSPVGSPPLKIGDEVEVTGLIHSRGFQTELQKAQVQLLWQANAAPPLSVTANQAASGAYDSMFVQVEGVLSRKVKRRDGIVVLSLDSGSQSFGALISPGRTSSVVSQLRIGASLRLRGVSVSASEFTGNTTPFTLLVRSAEDVQVIAGPPWWALSRLVPVGVAALVILAVAGQIYVFAKHWRLRAVLEERGRLAHEIHDTLAQSFAGIGYQLRAVRKGLPPDHPTLQEQLDLACEMVRHSHEEARRSIATLRPETLEMTGLETALKNCGLRMTQNGPVVITASVVGNPVPIPLRVKDTLFRIGQEAIANAIRHAEAKSVQVIVRFESSSVKVTVTDDGKGFEPQNVQGFGIVGMRKRAKSVSATLSVDSSPRAGTAVVVTVSLPARLTLATWPRYLVQYKSRNATSY